MGALLQETFSQRGSWHLSQCRGWGYSGAKILPTSRQMLSAAPAGGTPQMPLNMLHIKRSPLLLAICAQHNSIWNAQSNCHYKQRSIALHLQAAAIAGKITAAATCQHGGCELTFRYACYVRMLWSKRSSQWLQPQQQPRQQRSAARRPCAGIVVDCSTALNNIAHSE